MGVPGNANTLLLKSAAAGGAYEISRSLRFNAPDSAYLSKSFASAGNRKTWTWAAWVKRSKLADYQRLFWGGGECSIRFENDDTLRFSNYTGSFTAFFKTTAVYRDASAWYHIVLTVDTANATAADRLRLYVNGDRVTAFSSTTYPTQNLDLEINTATSHNIAAAGAAEFFSGYLAECFFIDGQALDPSSFTTTDLTTGQLVPKAYTGSYGTNGFRLAFDSYATTAALGTDTSGNGNTWTVNNFAVGGGSRYSYGVSTAGLVQVAITSPTGTWADSFDGNLSTMAVRLNSTGTATWTGSIPISSSLRLRIGSAGGSAPDIVTNLGSVTAPALGYPSTSWVTVSGAAGQTLTSIQLGSIGNANNWIAAVEVDGIVLVDTLPSNDSLVDTPTSFGTDTGVGGEVRGNYCTWNPLNETTGTRTLTNGNLDASIASTGGAGGTVRFNTGKWYYEATINSTGDARAWVGWLDESFPRDRNDWSYGSKSILYASNAARGTDNGSYGATFTAGDVIGCALDLDGGTATFYKNGVSQGTMGSSLGATNWRPVVSTGGTAWSITANFGQRAFAYTAPSGFKALVDTNLPAPVVAKPNTVFDIALSTGTGATRSVTGLNFTPDLLWFKGRSSARDNVLYDSVRGTTKSVSSNLTASEYTGTDLVSFNSNGFTVGPTDVWYAVNETGLSIVTWAWDAGTSTVTNTSGSISSQVRANPAAGFSVVTWTATNGAATIGHGLGVAPEFIIVKDRDTSTFWQVYHKSMGNTNAMSLNSTNAASAGSGNWNNTSPTSTVFSVGVSSNYLTDKHVAYCFAPVSGYSSFGSYTGTGTSDGSFIFLGFRPKWFLLKPSTAADGWRLFDSVRNTYNYVDLQLSPSSSNAEADGDTDYAIDFLSNGVKIRAGNSGINGSGVTFIYAAFAENPFQYARAR